MGTEHDPLATTAPPAGPDLPETVDDDSLMTRVGAEPGASGSPYATAYTGAGAGSLGPSATGDAGPAGAKSRFGDYEIVRQIAKGGMGFVYEARHVRLGLPVALKLIGAGGSATEGDIQRFLLEARSVAKLHKHPNIVKIYGIDEEDGQHYFAMQLIRGGSLKDRLAECSADPRRAVEIMVRVADAIAHAHRRGILHRDLKPDNILIDEEGSPYVTDFGLAKRVDPAGGDPRAAGPGPPPEARRPPFESGPPGEFESNEAEGDSILGTPSFMPPEQALGRSKDVSTLSDVYGLGATLFAMLCNRPPFVGGGIRDVLDKVIAAAPPSPRALNPRVDRDLEAACLKAIEKDPRARYESAEAFARDLRRWLDGRPVHARPVSALGRAARWSRREPLQATAAGLGAILIGTVAALAISVAVDRSRIRQARIEMGLARERGKLLEEQKRLAEGRAKLARDESRVTLRAAGEAVEKLVDSFEAELGAESQQQKLRHQILGHALRYFEGVVSESRAKPVGDWSSRLSLARAHQRVAGLAGKVGTQRRDDVTRNYRDAIAILEGLRDAARDGTGDVDPGAILAELGNAYHEYGITRWDRGEAEAALALYERGREARQRACPECPSHGNLRGCGCVGDVGVRTGLGRSWGYIGDVHEAAGRVEEADRAYRTSHEIRRKLFDDLKADREAEPEATIQLARSFDNLAMLDRRRGDLARAILGERQAIDLLGGLVRKPLGDADRRRALADLAAYLRGAAEYRLEDGEPEKAIPEADEAIGHLEGLVRERPGVVPYRLAEASARIVRAEAFLGREDLAGASTACQRAEVLLEGARDFREDLDYRLAAARRDTVAGRIALREGRPAEAAGPLARAENHLDSLIERDPGNDQSRSDRAEVLALLAEAYRIADPARASASFRRALDEQRGVVERGGRVRLFRDRLDRLMAARSRFP